MRRLTALLIFSTLLSLGGASLSAGPAAAQSDCGGYTCVDASNFDSTVDGWAAGTPETQVSWIESKAFSGNFWLPRDGVLKSYTTNADSLVIVKKEFYAQPGQYRVLWSSGADGLDTWVTRVYVVSKVSQANDVGGTQIAKAEAIRAFQEHTSDLFTVTAPGSITIIFATTTNVYYYMDYAWLVQDTGATATPVPGQATATPRPGTPIPEGAQATSIAVPTQYCYTLGATATPGLPQFGPTATPTATPNAVTDWAVFDAFDLGGLSSLYWRMTGSYVDGSTDTTHSGTHYGAVSIGFTVDPPGWDGTSLTRSGIVFERSGGFPNPFYVDGWSMAEVIPTGATASLQVYKYSDIGIWSSAGSQQISARNWYPFHVTISTADIQAIAILTTRSDEPVAGSGAAYVDDVLVYGNTTWAPRCDGSLPAGANVISGEIAPTTADSTQMLWPLGRLCPKDLTAPNNFWGPLLAQLTLFMDHLSAFWPLHVEGITTDIARSLIQSPLVTFVVLAGTFFDLRLPLLAVSIILAAEGARAALSIWMVIKRAIPFLN